MNLTKIKEGSVILAPSYLHNEIRNELLQQTKGMGGITITSFSTYFLQNEPTSIFTYYQVMKEALATLRYHQDNATRIAFIEELKQCIQHVQESSTPLSCLPQEDPYQQEMVSLLSLLYPLEKTNTKLLEAVRSLQDASHLYIINTYTTLFEKALYETLVCKGATLLQEEMTPITKHFFHALNKRQEVEACCQYIIENNIVAEKIRMSVLDTSYFPYIHQMMKQYKIPYTLYEEKEVPLLFTKYIALLSYYLQENTQTSCDLYLQHVFTHPYEKECIQYMQLYDLTFSNFTTLTIEDTNQTLPSKEIKHIQNVEKKAIEAKESIQEDLHTLLSKQGIDVLYTIDSLLCKHHIFLTKDDRKALFKLRSFYPTPKDITHTKDLSFFLSLLKRQSLTTSTTIKGVSISTLQKTTLAREYHIVLGANQNNYPAFTSRQGIFDEDFYAKIPYPSQQSRYAHHMQQVEKNILTCKHLVVMYCFSTLEGKTQEASLEMESLLQMNSTMYPLKQTHTSIKRTHTITQAQAQQVYAPKQILHGSISSIEKYVNCPYAYFLRYGLQLYDPIDVTFSIAKAGSFMHSILEHLTNTYQKQYTKVTQEEMTQLVHDKIQLYTSLYPNQKAYFLQHAPRIVDTMMKNIEALQEHEEHSSLHPYASEENFSYSIPIDDVYTLQLQGVIDRIDANNTHFRIVDFKSSSKTINEKDIYTASALQLATYACIMEEVLQKRALGSFYYSLANPNLSMYYAKLKKRPLSYYYCTEDNIEEERQKNKRLSGLIYSESISVCDDNGSHIKNVSIDKEGNVSAKTIYHPQVLSASLKKIYQILSSKILQGDIACEPSESACTYCSYASICKHTNQTYEKEMLIEVDDTLYLKGGKKND